MPELKVGLIGAGGIARGRHIPCFQRNPKAALVAIADVAEGAAERVSREFGIPAYYTDYSEMIDKEGLDAVVICTPNKYHAPVTIDGRRYLDAGLSAAIPFRAAFADGATHVLLLRSRRLGDIAADSKGLGARLTTRMLRRIGPEVANGFATRATREGADEDLIVAGIGQAAFRDAGPLMDQECLREHAAHQYLRLGGGLRVWLDRRLDMNLRRDVGHAETLADVTDGGAEQLGHRPADLAALDGFFTAGAQQHDILCAPAGGEALIHPAHERRRPKGQEHNQHAAGDGQAQPRMRAAEVANGVVEGKEVHQSSK